LSQGAFIACSVFWILDRSDGPMFQHPWDPSSGNLWHAIDSQICLNLTKAYTNFSSNDSEVLPSVAHDQIVHSFGSFIVGGLFWPPITIPLLTLADFTQCFMKGTPSQVYPWSIHGFPWGTSLSYRGTWDGSDFNFLHLV
jgi:hypothetical protein